MLSRYVETESRFQNAGTMLTIPPMNYLNPLVLFTKSEPKNLIPNTTLHLCGPFGSQFLSPPTTLSRKCCAGKKNSLLSSVPWVKSCSPTGDGWVLSSQSPIPLPEKVTEMGLESEALDRCVPGPASHQRAFLSRTRAALFSFLRTYLTHSQERKATPEILLHPQDT